MFNPDEMLSRMPYRIFQEWLQFHEQEPFGQEAFRLGFVAAGLGTLLVKPKGKKAWRPSDFMPDAPRQQTRTPQQQFDYIFRANQLLGGKFIDKRKKS